MLAACSTSKEELIVDKELDYCNRQVHRTLDIMRGKGDKIDYTMMPRNILDGQYDWNYRKATKDEWCSISPSIPQRPIALPPCFEMSCTKCLFTLPAKTI